MNDKITPYENPLSRIVNSPPFKVFLIVGTAALLFFGLKAIVEFYGTSGSIRILALLIGTLTAAGSILLAIFQTLEPLQEEPNKDFSFIRIADKSFEINLRDDESIRKAIRDLSAILENGQKDETR
jgi:uncharacterized membrane protein required for colicin V production